MTDTWLAIPLAFALLFLLGLSLVLLISPSKFLGRVQNPLQPDTPVNRVHARAIGIFFFLFPLLIVSGDENS
jgi:hypothetical protein